MKSARARAREREKESVCVCVCVCVHCKGNGWGGGKWCMFIYVMYAHTNHDVTISTWPSVITRLTALYLVSDWRPVSNAMRVTIVNTSVKEIMFLVTHSRVVTSSQCPVSTWMADRCSRHAVGHVVRYASHTCIMQALSTQQWWVRGRMRKLNFNHWLYLQQSAQIWSLPRGYPWGW